MTKDEEKRIKFLAKSLYVKYGAERKGKAAGKRLCAIFRVVKDGIRSPEVKSLRSRMIES